LEQPVKRATTTAKDAFCDKFKILGRFMGIALKIMFQNTAIYWVKNPWQPSFSPDEAYPSLFVRNSLKSRDNPQITQKPDLANKPHNY
jgi:hypothetical protein